MLADFIHDQMLGRVGQDLFFFYIRETEKAMFSTMGGL